MASASSPRTPVSSTASSFLTFSPEALRTLNCASGNSPGVDEVGATPRASRQLLINAFARPVERAAFKLEAPPAARRRTQKMPAPPTVPPSAANCAVLKGSVGSFGSNNPFAAIVARELVGASSVSNASTAASSEESTATESSSSSLNTPTQDSTDEDDLVIYGCAPVQPAPSITPGWRIVDATGLDASLEALGLADEGDVSSAWEDALYSSLSDASPVEPAFPPRLPRLSFQAPSPEQKRRAPYEGPGSPRHARSAASSSRHPYRRKGAATPASPSPKRSPRRTLPRKHSAPGSPSRSRAPVGAALTSLSSPDLDAFQLDPTSPIPPLRFTPRRLPFGLPAFPASLSRPRPSPSPPKKRASPLPVAEASTTYAFDTKRSRRAAKEAARAAKERARDRSADGIDLEELDRFFGITPMRGKAVRGGYGNVAVAEGVLGGAGLGATAEMREEQAWREKEEFRGLLEGEASGAEDYEAIKEEEGAYGATTSGEEADSGRRDDVHRTRPPPLRFATSSRHRSASLSSSIISFDDAASALDARIALASPIDLSPVPTPVLLSSRSPRGGMPGPTTLSSSHTDSDSAGTIGDRPEGLFAARTSSLPLKRSLGTRVKGLCDAVLAS